MEKRSNADAVTGPHQYLCKGTCRLGVSNNSIACCITRESTWLDQSHYHLQTSPYCTLQDQSPSSSSSSKRERERESIKSERPCPRRSQVIQPTADQNTMPITLDQENITTRSIIPPLLSESKVPRQSIFPKARNRKKTPREKYPLSSHWATKSHQDRNGWI